MGREGPQSSGQHPLGRGAASGNAVGYLSLGPPARPALSCYESGRCFCLPEQVRVGRVLKMIVKSQPCSNDLDSEAGPWGRRMSLHWAVTTRALHFHMMALGSQSQDESPGLSPAIHGRGLSSPSPEGNKGSQLLTYLATER